jgi:hypothetical protein
MMLVDGGPSWHRSIGDLNAEIAAAVAGHPRRAARWSRCRQPCPSSVVEHAYRAAESPGDIEVRRGFTGEGDGPRWAAVSVIDHGVWCPIPA